MAERLGHNDGVQGGFNRAVRRCVACRRRGLKTELFRIVATPEGAVVGDGSGKRAGRGAYVCGQTCFERARQSRRIGPALRRAVNEDELDALASAVASWEKRQNRE